MSIKNEKILIYVILGIVIFVSLKILLPKMYDDSTDINFKDYEKVDITSKKLNDKNSYNEIKNKLENDEYFKKIVFIDFYNSANVTNAELKNMLQTMTYAFSSNNDRYFVYKDDKEGVKCLNEFNTKKAFKELFGVDIKDNLDFLIQFYQYMYLGNNKYCFNFKTIYDEFDYKTLININKMEIDSNNNIIVDLYKYDFPSKYDSINIKNIIDSGQYEEAKNYVINQYNGTFSHKEVKFKENPRGRFYKYQLIYLKKLD